MDIGQSFQNTNKTFKTSTLMTVRKIGEVFDEKIEGCRHLGKG